MQIRSLKSVKKTIRLSVFSLFAVVSVKLKQNESVDKSVEAIITSMAD